ncbi:MAG: hypothetical protein JSV82_09045 [Planctomycetota bacterium]|nr:MAG: hypothetical protein JSV82_09045 [Planctomycetota bacterium]
MKTKTIIKIVLLLFISGSVAYLVVEEVGSRPVSSPAEKVLPEVEPNQGPSSEAVVTPNAPPEASQKVVVYYFHGTFRCPTCRKFEAFSSEALRESFSDELEDGRLKWQVVNVDKPGNGHFVRDYQLHTRAIVIVKIRDGKQTEWKNLEKIWGLVGDKKAFVKYIQSEVSTYLGAS